MPCILFIIFVSCNKVINRGDLNNPLPGFIFYVANVQKIYKVNYESQADIKVFIVDYESQADLNVFYVKYESQASTPGLWFPVKYESQADKKIYFADYEAQADLRIYIVKHESYAGWRNSSKVICLIFSFLKSYKVFKII